MVIVHYPIFKLYMVWLILDAGCWLLVSGRSLRYEVGGLRLKSRMLRSVARKLLKLHASNLQPTTADGLTSGLKPRRRLPLSRVGHRADQFQEPETSDQEPATSIEYQESSIKSQ